MKHSEKFLQQRRFYMMLPVLVLPFITAIFWALGGGQGAAAHVKESSPGLNLELPGAHFDKDDELWDKFSLYEQARRDSIKYQEARKNDPYYTVSMLTTNVIDTVPATTLNTSLGSKKKKEQLDANAALINKKLEQLTAEIEQPRVTSRVATESVHASSPVAPDTSMSADVDRLEKMMQMMSSGSAEDPEMRQINGMLDKILDVQHPERINEKLRAEFPKSHKDFLEVKPTSKEDNITLVGSKIPGDPSDPDADSADFAEPSARNSFFGLDEESAAKSDTGNSIEAVIHGTQSVVAGSTIKMRLLTEVTIKGQTIRKGQFIYGVCSVSGERLMISINSLRNDNSLLPVSLKVYDLDGLEGIYTPGAIIRDAAKQATNSSVQEVQLSSLDNSIGMQAATAGVSAAKGLFSKKVKLVKVTVKAGYRILLKDSNQKI